MSWRAYLARLICPEAFRMIQTLDEVRHDLLRKKVVLDSTLIGMERGIRELRRVLRDHDTVHVVLGIDYDGEVHPCEAHFNKETAERRRNELDAAAELAFKKLIHQVEQIQGQVRKSETTDAPTIPWEHRMVLPGLSGLSNCVGWIKFVVLSMPTSSPDKGKIIDLPQAKKAAEEPATEEPSGS